MLYRWNPSQGLPIYTIKWTPSSISIILRGSSRQVGVKVGGGVEKKLSDCLPRLKPPGFITPRQLLPRYLDSSPEKVQKLVLKPVLYCWCQLWFFTSTSCGWYALCSTAQRHGSARAELSSCGVPRQCAILFAVFGNRAASFVISIDYPAIWIPPQLGHHLRRWWPAEEQFVRWCICQLSSEGWKGDLTSFRMPI